jgi:hypothetical protein
LQKKSQGLIVRRKLGSMSVCVVLKAQGRRPMMLGDSVAGLVLVTAASQKPGVPETIVAQRV